jgi:tetratricopeptide (TPR) repeat protein
LNKPNNIRKKALEHVKKGRWDKALEEFLRLVEVEQHNPNLFNEIGDIHLKLANKREAFTNYHKAINAYAKVGLLNNAVAVCKKILRLNPSDDMVYGRMAVLRQSQGFEREAVAYSIQFLERVGKKPGASDPDLTSLVVDIVGKFPSEAEILERAAACLSVWDAPTEAGGALEKLDQLYLQRGMTADRERIKMMMKDSGYVPSEKPTAPPEKSTPLEKPVPVEKTGQTARPDRPANVHQPVGGAPPGKTPTGETHRPAAIALGADSDAPLSKSIPSHIRRGHDRDVAADFGVIDMGNPEGGEEKDVPASADQRGSQPAGQRTDTQARSEFDPDPSARDVGGFSKTPAAPVAVSRSRLEVDDDEPAQAKEYVIPIEDTAGGLEEAFRAVEKRDDRAVEKQEDRPVRAPDREPGRASEVKADVEAGDYRSHYDLGMAYLEMGLLSEAIREFEYAANSPEFQIRSLEMIGCCLISQNQPELAIKRLNDGLALVEGDDRSALGIKYSLAIAHEMKGELDTARTYFEDVYVLDSTFRDVAEKMRKYASETRPA